MSTIAKTITQTSFIIYFENEIKMTYVQLCTFQSKRQQQKQINLLIMEMKYAKMNTSI